MIPFMQSLPSSPALLEFMDSQDKNSDIDNMIGEVEKWLQTGDTSKLPGGIDMPMSPSDQYENMRPVKMITDACFELAYEHAYKNTSRDDTIYADCIITVQCAPGDNCSVEVTAEEISELIPGSQPEDFEDIWVGFDLTPEESMVVESDDGMMWTWIEYGVAVYEFVNNTDTPFLMGIQIWPEEVTNNKTIEMCRRKIVFEETFVAPDVNYDEIEVDEDYDDTVCISTSILTGTSYQENLSLLRDFRDNILTKTSPGKTIIDLYYRFGKDVLSILDKNQLLKDRCRHLLLHALPTVQFFLSADKPIISSSLLQEINSFLTDLETVSSPSLKKGIVTLRSYISLYNA